MKIESKSCLILVTLRSLDFVRLRRLKLLDFFQLEKKQLGYRLKKWARERGKISFPTVNRSSFRRGPVPWRGEKCILMFFKHERGN